MIAGRAMGAARLVVVALATIIAAGCGTSGPSISPPSASQPSAEPDWYGIEMTDVRTGASFSIHDFAGSVVLIETMAEWCPTCIEQQREVHKLRDTVASADLVTISLDIDLHEDAASLKEYAAALGYEWRFAVAPLEVARALGNLYSAEYLNPPFSPMLAIDRHGHAIQLPYGVKSADLLRQTLAPLLAG